MERAEAQAIYEQGREAVVALLFGVASEDVPGTRLCDDGAESCPPV